MKKKGKGIAIVALLSIFAAAAAGLAACGGGNGGGGGSGDGDTEKGHFDYPGNYETPELKIDGKGDESQWNNATTITYGRNNAVTAKIYRGEKALFFLFDVKDSNLLTQGVTNDDAVTRGDSIEFYLDTKADGGLHPQSDDFQINLGIHGKTRIMQGAGNNWGSWNGLIDYEVSLDGTLNSENDGVTDKGYTIEAMVQYKDIQIEKDANIGISFGQVDKWNAADSPSGGNDSTWNWFGWMYNGNLSEPQTPDNYIILKEDGSLIARDDMPMPAALVGGTVTDSDGDPIVGATAKTIVGGNEIVATTDEDGYFVFSEKLDSEGTYTVTVEKDGYLTGMLTYTRAELRAVKGGKVEKTIALITKEGTITVTGTIKNIVNGAVGGATVRVKGLAGSVTADANGNFTLEDVPTKNLPANNVIVNNNTVDKGGIILVVSKEGYGESETWIESATLEGADGTLALGDVNINLPYGNTKSFGMKNNLFAESKALISRTLTGVEFKFTGLRRLAGKVEFYLDTKASADNRDNDPTWWRFDLQGNGNLGGDFRGNPIPVGQTASDKGIQYRLIKNDDDGYEAYLYLPYSYLGIAPFEIFGVSFGQWSDSANDWDGWGYDGFIAPEIPQNYVRIAANNSLYKANSNETLAAFSGNVSMGGVKITANGTETTSAADGSWSMNVPVTSDAITVTYSKQGYVAQTQTIAAGYFNTVSSWTGDNISLAEEKVTISGTVTDSEQTALSGVTVTVKAGETLLGTATTGVDGTYSITNIETFNGVVIKFEKEGYASREVEKTAQQLSEEAPLTISTSLTSTSQIKKITISGSVTGIGGAVQGATVTVDGTELSAQTDADGNWSISNVDGVDGKVTVSKDGYLSATLDMKESDITANAIEFDSAFLAKDYTEIGGAFATGAGKGEGQTEKFASITPSVTRGENAFLFKFVAEREFSGRIEFFVNTGRSSISRDTATTYWLNISADGTVTRVEGANHEGATSPTCTKSEDGKTFYLTLPYDYIGVQRTEIVGVAFGQWSESANGWDGWNYAGATGVNGTNFVDPAMPVDYIRIGADNVSFWNAENKTLEEFNPTGYDILFGMGLDGANPTVPEADHFYGKVASRNENGVTFSFITTGDFGTRAGEKEMILIYFDKGESINGWENVDYLVKVASDGTVYGSNGSDKNGNINNPGTGNQGSASWWSANDNFKLDITATINRENGVTTVEVTIPHSVIGISASESFGVAMREASHNAGDHSLYDPWFDCYYHGERIDAAWSKKYARVDENGQLSRSPHYDDN